MKSLFLDFLNLFYPNVCVVCGTGLVQSETSVCFNCLHEMPKTTSVFQEDYFEEKRFWGKVAIESAYSFLYFQKGNSVQQVLHALKYQGNKEIGIVLGRYLGRELLHTEKFNQIDCIAPVPLHTNKLKKRGYNQSEMIATGIAEVMNKPVVNNLVKIKENESQTYKGVFDRWQNTASIFKQKDVSFFEGKHVLLVDDVLTTGSTIEACATEILKSTCARVSVTTLAIA